MKKIEIGSGRMPHAGYETIDVESYANPTYLGDFRNMSFKDVDEIRTHHLLEHFSRKESIEVLKLWRSWLKEGGQLIVETPDIEEICHVWGTIRLWGTKDLLIRHMYGSQETDWAYHKDGWYKEKFEEILPKVGFKITLIKQQHSYIRADNGAKYRLPNILVIANKI